MKAIVCEKFAPIGELKLAEFDRPQIKDGHVLIEVGAASVNFPDALIVQGLYQNKPPLPFVPGHELCGIVREVGQGVTRFKVSDRVVATPGVGAFAEFALSHEDKVIAIPAHMSMIQGAAITLTYGTSLHALKNIARLQAGERLWVLGASGGVGLAAIELGKLMGATVIAAASTQDKLQVCESMGADVLINYETEDLKSRIKEATSSKGVDVVYDAVGGKFSEAALRSLAWRGRFLVVGFASGEIPKIALNLALLSERSLMGVFWGEWIRREPLAHLKQMDFIIEQVRLGHLNPKVNEVYALQDAVRAIEQLAMRKAIGKLVIQVNSTVQ